MNNYYSDKYAKITAFYITLPHSPHLPDNSVLAITGGGVGGAVGGALLLVVGVLLCALIMKLKLLHSATDNSQGKLHDQLFNM